jgi:hypothetical protein
VYDREERGIGEGVHRSVVGAWHPFSGDELTTGKGIQWAGLSLEEKGEIERGGTGK